MKYNHIPILLNEVIEGLNIKPNGIYVDGTLGGGGHSLEIVKRLKEGGRLIAIDKDEEAILAASQKLEKYKDRITYIHDDFKNAISNLDRLGIDKIDGVLLDLGVSSYQLDNIERGFSYMNEAVLDMRMDKTQSLTAFNVVNEYSEAQLMKIFFEYGEEKFSRKIASKIVETRKNKTIRTTKELADLIDECIPFRFKKTGGHPAKRIFQAIRIEVNGELLDLDKAVTDLTLRLKEGGRICVLTFHSLEDRIVKQTLKYLELDCICDKHAPICTCNKRQDVKIITKKPIEASKEEIKVNSRSQSAKLRIAERK